MRLVRTDQIFQGICDPLRMIRSGGTMAAGFFDDIENGRKPGHIFRLGFDLASHRADVLREPGNIAADLQRAFS
jgi:hypothetical protein